jgi:hypothetical protein
MSKYKWPLNLQLFAEEEGGGDDFSDDSASIPEDDFDDDFGDDEPGEQDTEQDEAEDTTPADDVTDEPSEPAQPELKIPVKFDKQELELSLEEAQRFAQMGMNQERAIARARQEAAQEARDSYIAEQGYEWNGKPITTEAEYKAAIAEQQLMQQYENLPPELVDELMAGRRDREERAREKQAAQEQAARDAELSDFLAMFQQLNDRPFDGSKDVVPQAVWEAQKSGTPLKYAYMQHHSAELRNQLKISKQNETNSRKAAIGSVSANGTSKQAASDPFLAAWDED